jgi:hypothetical protein
MYICTSLIIRLQASLDACFGFSEVVDAFIKYQSKFKFKLFLFRLERTSVYVSLILCDGVTQNSSWQDAKTTITNGVGAIKFINLIIITP